LREWGQGAPTQSLLFFANKKKGGTHVELVTWVIGDHGGGKWEKEVREESSNCMQSVRVVEEEKEFSKVYNCKDRNRKKHV